MKNALSYLLVRLLLLSCLAEPALSHVTFSGSSPATADATRSPVISSQALSAGAVMQTLTWDRRARNQLTDWLKGVLLKGHRLKWTTVVTTTIGTMGVAMLTATRAAADQTLPAAQTVCQTITQLVIKSRPIESGETLTSIAKQSNTTIDFLLKQNSQIHDPDLILAGDTIHVPTFQSIPNPFAHVAPSASDFSVANTACWNLLSFQNVEIFLAAVLLLSVAYVIYHYRQTIWAMSYRTILSGFLVLVMLQGTFSTAMGLGLPDTLPGKVAVAQPLNANPFGFLKKIFKPKSTKPTAELPRPMVTPTPEPVVSSRSEVSGPESVDLAIEGLFTTIFQSQKLRNTDKKAVDSQIQVMQHAGIQFEVSQRKTFETILNTLYQSKLLHEQIQFVNQAIPAAKQQAPEWVAELVKSKGDTLAEQVQIRQQLVAWGMTDKEIETAERSQDHSQLVTLASTYTEKQYGSRADAFWKRLGNQKEFQKTVDRHRSKYVNTLVKSGDLLKAEMYSSGMIFAAHLEELRYRPGKRIAPKQLTAWRSSVRPSARIQLEWSMKMSNSREWGQFADSLEAFLKANQAPHTKIESDYIQLAIERCRLQSVKLRQEVEDQVALWGGAIHFEKELAPTTYDISELNQRIPTLGITEEVKQRLYDLSKQMSEQRLALQQLSRTLQDQRAVQLGYERAVQEDLVNLSELRVVSQRTADALGLYQKAQFRWMKLNQELTSMAQSIPDLAGLTQMPLPSLPLLQLNKGVLSQEQRELAQFRPLARLLGGNTDETALKKLSGFLRKYNLHEKNPEALIAYAKSGGYVENGSLEEFLVGTLQAIVNEKESAVARLQTEKAPPKNRKARQRSARLQNPLPPTTPVQAKLAQPKPVQLPRVRLTGPKVKLYIPFLQAKVAAPQANALSNVHQDPPEPPAPAVVSPVTPTNPATVPESEIRITYTPIQPVATPNPISPVVITKKAVEKSVRTLELPYTLVVTRELWSFNAIIDKLREYPEYDAALGPREKGYGPAVQILLKAIGSLKLSDLYIGRVLNVGKLLKFNPQGRKIASAA